MNSPGLLVFIGSFFLLTAYSVSPTVYAGDSSLFSAASYHLGTAHPPAYPLLVALGKIFTFFPFGNIAFKTNLMSAFFGALTAALAYKASLYLTGHRALSLFAPLVIISSPLFVLESSKVEAYSLNAFLIMLVFYLGLRAVQEENSFREILLASFLIGLGMGNHHTIGFMLPLVFLVIILRWRSLPVWTIPLALVFCTIGLSIYAYIPMRSAADAYVNYSPAGSLRELVDIFLRRGYGGGTMSAIAGVSANTSGWFYAAKNAFTLGKKEISFIVFLLMLAGLIGSARNRRTLLYMLGALLVWLPLTKMTMASSSLSPSHVSIIVPYYLQIIALAAVFAAAGLFACYRLLRERSALVAAGMVAAFLLFQSVQAAIAIERSSISDYYVAHTWTRDISKVLSPRSIYVASGDNPSFLSFYAFGVERVRDDVLVLDSMPGSDVYKLTISPEWKYGDLFPEFFHERFASIEDLNAYAQEERVFASSAGSLSPVITEHFEAKGQPLMFLLAPKGQNYPVQEEFFNSFEKIDYLPVVIGHKKDIMTAEINDSYAKTILHYAKMLAEKHDGRAENHFKLAFAIANPKTKYAVLKDYLIYMSIEKGPQEARTYMEAMQASISDESTREIFEELSAWYESLDEEVLLEAHQSKTYTASSEYKQGSTEDYGTEIRN
jgi:hypothetical protein